MNAYRVRIVDSPERPFPDLPVDRALLGSRTSEIVARLAVVPPTLPGRLDYLNRPVSDKSTHLSTKHPTVERKGEVNPVSRPEDHPAEICSFADRARPGLEACI